MGRAAVSGSRRFSGTALVLLGLLSGCGGAGVEQASNRGQATTSASVGASTTVASVTNGPTSPPTGPTTTLSPLQRRDAPPEGVKAQFEFFQEGDGACVGLDESKPAAVVDFPKPEIAMTFIICFPGFTHNQPVQADVRLPDGKVRKITASFFNTPEGVPYASWTSVPGDPLGTYQVSASQGTRQGTGTFTVAAASTPRTVGIEPTSGAPGTAFRFALAGFGAGSVVDLYLYRGEGNGIYRYLTTVTVTMDGNGQTILNFPTRADDPKGSYCFVRRGPKAAPDYFCALNFSLT